jgi:hypothetical protein
MRHGMNFCRLFESHDYVTKMYVREQLTIVKMKDNESMTKHLHTFLTSYLQLVV